MLAGHLDQMDTRVFEAESVNHLWKTYPLMFRIAMLPFVIAIVLRYQYENHPHIFINIGQNGSKIDLVNDSEVSASNNSALSQKVAYAAESYLLIENYSSIFQAVLISIIEIMQTVVWCLKGQQVDLLLLGDEGGLIPEWAWEVEKNGPRVNNIRILSFDAPPEPSD